MSHCCSATANALQGIASCSNGAAAESLRVRRTGESLHSVARAQILLDGAVNGSELNAPRKYKYRAHTGEAKRRTEEEIKKMRMEKDGTARSPTGRAGTALWPFGLLLTLATPLRAVAARAKLGASVLQCPHQLNNNTRTADGHGKKHGSTKKSESEKWRSNWIRALHCTGLHWSALVCPAPPTVRV